ncbi:MAG: DUF167 domain-containing protein [Candidatus Pacebacteria bacterium]|nr:DUF167 domain-containing protein [Candidatus Paceibacterota bacterium]
MKFKCKVITRSSKNEVLGIDNLNQLGFKFKDNSIDKLPELKIYLTAVPVDGKANKELIKLLSKELNVSKSKINIIKGEKNKEKIIEVLF